MSGRLQGKVAMVTGGASGIGADTVRLFVEQGARVVIADVQAGAADALVAELGGAARFERLDVSDPDDWARAADATGEAFGGFDVLVNCAGISGGSADIEQIPLDIWNKVMAVNLTGTMLGCQNAVRMMKHFGRGGSIVNISSVVGIKAWAPRIAYGTSKAAVAHLTKAVALHCGQAGYGIRCNAIHPGTIDTPILDEQLKDFGNSREAMLEVLNKFQIIGRVGQPRELSSAILFLASDDASFVTGTSLVVDGGFVEL